MIRWGALVTRHLRQQRERGSATVLGVGAVLLLFTLLVAFLHIGAAHLGSLAARTAADHAALAGVGVLRAGGDHAAACAEAARVATANRARLVSCDPRPQTVEVRSSLGVEVAVPVPVLGGQEARARAAAGLVPWRDADRSHRGDPETGQGQPTTR